MPSQTDLFRTLPPNVRQCVYSYLFLNDGDCTVKIESKSPPNDWLSTVLALSEDPLYVTHYRGRIGNPKWPKEVDEAFFQVLRWMSKQNFSSGRMISGWRGTESIAELIYEFTGQKRDRKQVSSHTQVLKTLSTNREELIQRIIDEDGSYEVENRSPPDSDEGRTIFTQLPYSSSSNMASIFAEPPPPRPKQPTITRIPLSFTLINHFYRAESINYLSSHLHFDFGLDRLAFRHLCNTAPPDLITSMRHARLTLVEGSMPPLPSWPNLHTLALDLWPRHPGRPDFKERAWGDQTEELLARLGVTTAVRAKITLEMRWAADCERFEREYVGEEGEGGWRRVAADVEDGPKGRDEGFCRRSYELQGKREGTVGEADRMKMALALPSIFSSFPV